MEKKSEQTGFYNLNYGMNDQELFKKLEILDQWDSLEVTAYFFSKVIDKTDEKNIIILLS